jgi:nicotinate-nucleotide adenylyltransferase
MATVAVLGGSFNPPHVAHLLAAAYVLGCGGVDEVWVEPVWRHALGKPLAAPFAARLELCRLAFAPLGPRVQVRDDERDGSGRTLDLLLSLQAQHPGHRFRLIIGTDILGERHRWHRFDEVLRVAPPIVLLRPGHAADPALDAWTLPVELPDISSTWLRSQLAKGLAVDGWVPDAVLAALLRGGWYSADGGRDG